MPPQLQSEGMLSRKTPQHQDQCAAEISCRGSQSGTAGGSYRWFRSYTTAKDEAPMLSMGVIRSSR